MMNLRKRELKIYTTVVCGLAMAFQPCVSFAPNAHTIKPQLTFTPKSFSLREPEYKIHDTRFHSKTTRTSLQLQPEEVNTILQTSPTLISQVIASYTTSPYLFMLPTATLVATSCQLAGIGGAALFSPIFLLAFPFFGLELASPAQAVASALLTEVFGFASGLIGYSRRGLVDWSIATQFMITSIPFALIGAVSAKALAEDVLILRVLYATLMIGLASFLILSPRPEAIEEMAAEECVLPSEDGGLRTLTSADGTEYTYLAKPITAVSDDEEESEKRDVKGFGATAVGSALTGLLGVGVGEVILPQLVRGRCMPLPVAAGTSVAIVVVTALTAAVIQFLSLAVSIATPSEIDGSIDIASALISVVPWKLVEFTIPGVLIGGQLAPFLASRGILSDEQIETFAATLFGVVGIAFATKAILG